MKIIIKGTSKEIADLVVELQSRPSEKCRIPSEPYADNGMSDVEKIAKDISSAVLKNMKSFKSADPAPQEQSDSPVETDESLRLTLAKILAKQMKLLSKRSEQCSDECLADISDSITYIYTTIICDC